MQNGFYVYEHVRLDTMKPFYIGKGIGTRAYSRSSRNPHWHNVVKKHGYVVNMVAENLDEEMAFLVEMEKIDQLNRIGVSLVNITNGGGGIAGLVHSDEAKKKISDASKGNKHNLGRKQTDEHKKKISDALKGKQKSAEHTMKSVLARRGKKRTPEQIQRMKENRKPCVVTDETRAKLSRILKGKVRTKETKAKMAASALLRERIECPHCKIKVTKALAKRWHFDNCKKRG